ncbi:carbohydrate ABC transporter permease [Streptomyces sp. NPDC001508]|uniref:carbohydrate ABC transporter permease n=1 Tax=Streptomyces sp. NPDC001508 TaxID=3154656 RepID=UPI00332922D3
MTSSERLIRLRALPAHLALALAGALTLAPLVWMLGISLTTPRDIGGAALRPVPSHPTLENYRTALADSDIPLHLGNSVVFAGGVTLGLLCVSIPAAYALSRWRFRGQGAFVAAMLIGMSVPFVVTYIPNFLLLSRLHLLNTYPGLIVPHMANAFGVLLLMQHFRAFPTSVIEAAHLDGAGSWTTLTKIVLPAVKAPILAISLSVFISTWNELVWPQLVANKPGSQVLAAGLAQFASLEGGVSYGPLMASATMTALPTILLFLIFRRRLLAVTLEGAIR